ncbi:hypothetical protein T11_18076 [Trichinella zimbabwensis]|uniref:Uncharacterized protein n=1 Tax=Trichinella zimbabwensis TaxID=268475 RepID=A0A0V1HAV5_9BILA|nr:hypothetical protein T11_18076 [Trichinella zimbabwensis]
MTSCLEDEYLENIVWNENFLKKRKLKKCRLCKLSVTMKLEEPNEATGATIPPLLFIKTDSQKQALGLPGFGDVVSKQPFIK